MSSRPAKRVKLDPSLVPIGPNVVKLLSKLSKGGLADWAINSATNTNNQPSPYTSQDEGDESDDEHHTPEQVYGTLRDSNKSTKAEVIDRIQRDWHQGLSHTQLAQVEIKVLEEKPNSKIWTVYRLMHDTPRPVYASPRQFTNNLGKLLADYHQLHLHLHPTDSASTLRLQLLPAPPATLPPALFLIHLPATPFILLPSSVPPSLLPILLQSICAALSTPPAREAQQLQLSGKDWHGLADTLRGSMSSGGMAKWDKGRGEGGGPLVPKLRRREVDDAKGEEYVESGLEGRVVEDEPEARRGRQQEVGEVFGREELPVLEKLDYEISLPYPTPSADEDDAPPPFLLRLEGAHVLQGLREAVDSGFVDSGLPSWIGEAAREGRNALQVDERGVRW